jgi:hypothetical protein
MPGRNVSVQPLGRERRRSGLVLAALASVLGLLALAIAIGSRITSPHAPSASPAAPVVELGRPGRSRGSASATSTRSPAGAVAAAARSITAFDGDVLLEPARLRAVVVGIASRASRPQLLAAFAEASAQTRAKLGADTAPKPVIVLRSVPVGYRVERFSPGEATVSVWYVGIVGSGATVPPQQSWRTQVVSLVWEAGAWKVSSFASSPGPTPPLTAGEVAQEPGDLFSAMPRFEEFDRALP